MHWGWFWMSLMMVFWIVVLGALVYVAVRLGQRRVGCVNSSAVRIRPFCSEIVFTHPTRQLPDAQTFVIEPQRS